MSERSKRIFRLLTSLDSRTSYIRAKLSILVPSQIRALRLKSDMPRQLDLAHAAEMHQSRISMFETPGAANLTLETLSRLAAAFKVGVIVKFVPFSEMLRWENQYSQDTFDVTKLSADIDFLNPEQEPRIANLHGHSTEQPPNMPAAPSNVRPIKAGAMPPFPLEAMEGKPQEQMAIGG